MIRYSKNDFVDIEKYKTRIEQKGEILVDLDVIKEHAEELDSDVVTLRYMYLDLMIQKSSGNYRCDSRDIIINYLQKCERCPEHYFKTRKAKTESISTPNVLMPLLENGYAREFITYYTECKSAKTRLSKLRSLVDCAIKTDYVNKNGKNLYRIPFSVNKQVNLRFNYSACDIISQIPKKITNCITVEDDYVLVWGDFAQSDFRIAYNLFIRNAENDLIMNKYSDKYEGLARIVANELGEPFDKEKFLEQRDLYKVNTLSTIYGRTNSVVKENSEFIKMFSKFLEKCPRYMEYVKRLRDAHVLGLPIVVKSYFGNEEVSPVMYKETDIVNRALNVPIQTGTSEVIILTVNKILDKFYEMGYTEDDISLYLVRHDEPIFKVKRSLLKDAWVFEQFNQILVDNWTPLNISFSAGYSYGDEDEDLMAEYKKNVLANQDKIDEFTPGGIEEIDYYPVDKVMRVIANYLVIGDESVITFYDAHRNLAHSSVVKSTDTTEIAQAIRQIVQGMSQDLGYRGVLVENTLYAGEAMNGSTYVKYNKTSGTHYLYVNSLAQYTAKVYCERTGKDYFVEPLSQAMEEFVTSVGKLKEFVGG